MGSWVSTLLSSSETGKEYVEKELGMESFHTTKFFWNQVWLVMVYPDGRGFHTTKFFWNRV